MQIGGRTSNNVEDRRGMGPVMVGGGVGTVVLAIVIYLLGGDPTVVLQQPAGQSQREPGPRPAEENAQAHFVSVVLADTEDTWHQLFRQEYHREYAEPKLVMFTDVSRSACGTAESAMGPFYCPEDQTVYIDLGFYRDLQQRFGANGDFAQAYVIAHEVGHHVQEQLGLLKSSRGNAASVRTELQADCLAGVWAKQAERRKVLDPGDLEEALGAAAAIGDDRIQKRTQGRVVPESFTHGSSAQRVRWFKAGFDGGTTGACDTSRER